LKLPIYMLLTYYPYGISVYCKDVCWSLSTQYLKGFDDCSLYLYCIIKYKVYINLFRFSWYCYSHSCVVSESNVNTTGTVISILHSVVTLQYVLTNQWLAFLIWRNSYEVKWSITCDLLHKLQCILFYLIYTGTCTMWINITSDPCWH
jgi:hypothetical protein